VVKSGYGIGATIPFGSQMEEIAGSPIMATFKNCIVTVDYGLGESQMAKLKALTSGLTSIGN
jgi:hypothetical protein